MFQKEIKKAFGKKKKNENLNKEQLWNIEWKDKEKKKMAETNKQITTKIEWKSLVENLGGNRWKNHGNRNLLFGIYDNLVELSVNYGRMAFTNESDGGQQRLPSVNFYTHPLTTFSSEFPCTTSICIGRVFFWFCISISIFIYKYICI